jgi:hypothetical protein
MQQYLFLVILVVLAVTGNSFLLSSRILARASALQAATDGDPLDAVRAKMAADPNYDPMKDPQTMQMLEQRLPPEIRDASIGIERLKVAFKDAKEGVTAVPGGDLDAAAAKIGNQSIQSPQSAWFKNGQPNETDGAFSESKKQELLDKLQKANPQVPLK